MMPLFFYQNSIKYRQLSSLISNFLVSNACHLSPAKEWFGGCANGELFIAILIFHFVPGDEDKFLSEQLQPHKFEEACRKANVPLLLRMQPGYDHSYYFIATFIDDHIHHHAQALNL